MSRDVSVSFLVSVVFGHVVQVVPSYDNCPLHFSGDDNSLKDFATNGDVAGEGTFLVDIGAFAGFLGSFEAESDVLVVPYTA